jgi:hypothetical protein
MTTIAIARIDEVCPAVQHRRWAAELWRALAYAVALSVYFFAVYGTCGAITARLAPAAVGRAGFAWEVRWIPFVPAMIVPYMSIDLFFFAAPFLLLLRSADWRREMRDHARRVVLAVAIAGTCFLLFPMTTTFVRPQHIEGAFGSIFTFLYGFDRPYNLAPSLHLALWCLLWVVYSAHTRGVTRAAVRTWFILIALSTLLTYQHHVIDIVSGLGLGIFCLHIVPGRRDKPRSAHNVKVAWRYMTGAMAVVALGYWLRPWGLVLWWWPGATLAVMAAAYFGAGAGVFRKCDGRLAATTYLVLGPHLAGAWTARWLRARRDAAAFGRIAPGVWVGRTLGGREARELMRLGVTAVLDLTPEASEARDMRRLAYINEPILDLTTPTKRQLEEAVAFVRAHAQSGGGVYVHCLWGYSRSAAVGAAYLLSCGIAATVEEAVEVVRAGRPGIVVRTEVREVLRDFAKSGRLPS